ncbi:adenylosuccinate synthase [Myxococcota bacterium]|nr:adenylosuccinate synthase [Myxococcota bacterium]
MPIEAIVGANWGDEGKGKVTDYMAAQADVVIRYQGGRNAGHTVINDFGKFALHLLPSGVFYRHIENVLGPGAAIDLAALFEELDLLENAGVPTPRVSISDRAQVVLPHHSLLDVLEEERLGGQSFGSTRAGIAPFYADKYLKIGVQIADLFDTDRLRGRVESALVAKNVLLEHLYDHPKLVVDEVLDGLLQHRERLEPMVQDVSARVHDWLQAGQRVLLEGQLGALRDPDHGIYPFSTSSSPLAGFACVGAGVPPTAFERIVAVAKCYSTCVGAGPFVTELSGSEAEELRERGGDAGEYGATTGRPRRVGYFDAVATRYGCRIQGATEVVLTGLDVLGYLDEIPLCTAYSIEGAQVREFPTTARLDGATGVFESLEGWKTDVSPIREFGELPRQAQRYVEVIERLIETPVGWVSVGPERDAMIRRT